MATAVLLSVAFAVLVVYVSLILFEETLVAVLIALPGTLGLSLWLMRLLTKNMGVKLVAIKNGMRNLMDNDFSVSITNASNDELDEIIGIYNQLSEKLRAERQYIYQRELLLDTVINNSAMCVILIDENQRIIYSNDYAKSTLNHGRPINGLFFSEAIKDAPDALKEILIQRKDGLFRIQEKSGEELYHISSGTFTLNAQRHDLILIKEMTLELHKQEAAIWKRVIRTITHELNNSLAPISSMAHSGQLLTEKRKYEQLPVVFETIGERANHLKAFIEGYASIAKLPMPIRRPIEWSGFLKKLALSYDFVVEGDLPTETGYFDPVQIQQVLMNLLKNASESGSEAEQIFLRVYQNKFHSVIEVVDRGSGMSPQVMENALLPFYTTKPSGSGIGLSLCREIIEAHHGEITIANREGGGLKVRLTLPYEDK